MKRVHLILGMLNGIYLLSFGLRFGLQRNFEFLIYVGVVLTTLIWIGLSLKRVDYALSTLIGLSVWGLMHMAGGGIVVGQGRLYDVMLLRWSTTLPILRYDQVVHMWGFGSCVLFCYDLLKGQLADARRFPFSLGLVLVMAGLGLGAFNEIVEFGVTCAVPEAGVGGYLNTALDLCANLVGALLALLFLKIKFKISSLRWQSQPSL